MAEERDGGGVEPIRARATVLTTQILAAPKRSSIDDATYMAYSCDRAFLCQDEMLPDRSRDRALICDFRHNWFG